ncbi:MAG: hypothetical protein WD554_05495 [Flavobacteriaceae bacterium]
MKLFKPTFKKLACLLLAAVVSTGFQSCKSDKKEAAEEPEKAAVIEIITEDMEFQMQDTIPAGWNTFHYKNQSPQTHFFLIEKYPEGKTLDDALQAVVPVFSEGMDLINKGEFDEAMATFGNLPEWYGEVQFLGGSGLLSPETTGENTLKLEPGYYLIECYVKMPNGVFHTSMGMISDFVVADKDSEIDEPEAGIAIEISGEGGIVVNDSITAGTHTFSVLFKDQKVHENFVGHDVNLVKLEEGANLEVLEQWMNWADPKGLIEPAPEGFTFLGGVNDMPEGGIGYFTATLEPGNYALIAEVPNTMEKNMLITFEVD